jgi:uncharacterized protein YndB with AHSA1/START domain
MTVEKISFVYVTYIASTPEKVFDAITNPKVTRLYWGHENVSDWTPGSKWAHVSDNKDRTVQIVGEVVEISPPSRLVITWAGASQADDLDCYSRVTFEIEPHDNGVRLRVTHSDLNTGSDMANGVIEGWPLVLSSLKTYLETGKGFMLSDCSDAA